jgi:hypothetical protein
LEYPSWVEPELILRLTRPTGSPALVLVEAKLWSGKSSWPTLEGEVNDQLGKYWVHLEEAAKKENAQPTGIVYITQSLRFPDDDFAETQLELQRKHQREAPLFWLSWRHFEGCVRQGDRYPPAATLPILNDLLTLLVEKWGLAEVRMGPWPKSPDLPHTEWRFPLSWRWPKTLTEFPPWDFRARA